MVAKVAQGSVLRKKEHTTGAVCHGGGTILTGFTGWSGWGAAIFNACQAEGMVQYSIFNVQVRRERIFLGKKG